MTSLTSLPDGNPAEYHVTPNGMLTLFCPDCGTACQLTGTASFKNAWCFTCPNPKHKRAAHWVRFYKHVDYVKVAECEIPHDQSESLECPLCDRPSPSGTVHQECADREQATADRE